MKRYRIFHISLIMTIFAAVPGCGVSNPIKREPANVFPGTEAFDKRVSGFKITPAQAYRIAYDRALADNQVHFISKRPTVIRKRWYVFGIPLPSGANLQGYHVNGDNGEVKFHREKETIPHNRK